MSQLEKIQKSRTYWQDKLVMQVNELMFLSLEGDARQYEALQEAIETSMIILWRFDRRLEKYYDSDTTEAS